MKYVRKLLTSIIISAYNEEKHIEQCLLTLREQSYIPIEIIVVDDGSFDKTRKIAKEYADKIVIQKHNGLGFSRNSGAIASRGKILIFLDADMYFDRNYIQKLIEPILMGKEYATFTNEEYVANAENIWVKCGNIDNNIPLGKRYGNSQSSLVPRAIRKDLFMKLGGMKTDLGYRDDNIFLNTKYKALPAKGAICYHYNPDTLGEIYQQATWVGKNPILSKNCKNLLRYSILNSLIISYRKILDGAPLYFFIYKAVFDFGIFTGILSSKLTSNYAK